MQVTCNTKPVIDALDLGIISANISKHYRLSTMLQITGKLNQLIFNTAAANILSEMKVKGMSEGIEDDHPVMALIDAEKFKSLLSTLESNTIDLEFVEGGIVLHSGSSKFIFPAYVDSDDYSLPNPDIADAAAQSIDIQVKNWKFIQDNQMYALAASFVLPVYNNVWVSEDGKVLSGDFDTSLFTCSSKGKDLHETCLLPDTVVNLLASVPDGAKIVKLPNGYQIQVSTDAFDYVSQFTPKHEDDENVGSYNAEIIMSQFEASDNAIEVSLPALQKALNQINIVSNIEAASKVDLQLEGSDLMVVNNEVKSPIKVKVSPNSADWSTTFYFRYLFKAISHHNGDTINICPIINEDMEDVAGILLYDDDLQTVVASVAPSV